MSEESFLLINSVYYRVILFFGKIRELLNVMEFCWFVLVDHRWFGPIRSGGFIRFG